MAPPHRPTLAAGAPAPRGWRGRLGRWLQTYDVDEELAGRFRHRQLQALLRLTLPSMAANLVNGALLVLAFHETAHRQVVWLWAAALAATVLLGLRGWTRSRRRQGVERASPRALRRAAGPKRGSSNGRKNGAASGTTRSPART